MNNVKAVKHTSYISTVPSTIANSDALNNDLYGTSGINPELRQEVHKIFKSTGPTQQDVNPQFFTKEFSQKRQASPEGQSPPAKN